MDSDDTVTTEVCKEDDIGDGELLEVTVAGYPVLLVRNRKEFSALGSKCPHSGAPLSKGIPSSGQGEKPHHGGVAALVCAETLRQEGFTGRIIMATKEKHVPYDKSKLSKEMDLKAEDIYLRKPEFLAAQGIEIWTEKEAVSVDFQKQKVHFVDGSSQKYHQLLIATGSHANFLPVPGADLQNVCLLQTPEDSSKIIELATGRNLVVVGASFVGMEVAAFLSDKAGTISVVDREEFPFQHTLGPQVGGVALKVAEAVLANGEKLPADVVVVGTGSTPNSAFLKGTSITRDDKGAILVDLHMQTNIPNVFAAGDVVSFPVVLLNRDQSSIHHQQVAEAHGHCAALNMLKKGKELHTVPFFWTTLVGKSIRYAGCGKGYTDTVVKGSLEQQKFLIFYIRDGLVTAAASLNCDPMVSLIAEVLYLGKQISKEEAE
ncbi:apoptosis-inducing factor 3-like isoform X3 [Willisornis vidua]|uniref:Apoptosis-inducing factor 3-like isoform X3 n=1 Tax=Willisornis vidua TaxID=1566151 RepID=A0ABQ9DCU4_9PASS|nr:apoptosis-inducing factor 3-like isoform X3 [Willisornis vidua]